MARNKITPVILVMAVVMAVVMAGWACSLSSSLEDSAVMASRTPILAGAAMTNFPGPTPVMAVVMAENGLRLRDRPDQAGPVNSREILVMANGARFRVIRCEQIRGQWWAWGTYIDGHGRSWQGWAAARFLKGYKCDG